ncbi:MAG TPA: signal peptidase II [Acidobacteriaceae bacterium]|nr:signal peptidase II [Terriglobia bacterium]HVC91052.1 signal peptidase II [Acidobacteriaceae bacterium]
MSAGSARDPRLKLLLISVAVFVADRLTKLWILNHIISGQEITIIPRFFHLSHVYNNGAAFSLFSDTPSPEKVRWMLIAFSMIAIAIVLAVFLKAGRRVNATSIALALILGGAIGNLYDRLAYRYVIDFLAFNIFGYHYPDFNVADSCIVIGAAILLIEVLRAPKSAFLD